MDEEPTVGGSRLKRKMNDQDENENSKQMRMIEDTQVITISDDDDEPPVLKSVLELDLEAQQNGLRRYAESLLKDCNESPECPPELVPSTSYVRKRVVKPKKDVKKKSNSGIFSIPLQMTEVIKTKNVVYESCDSTTPTLDTGESNGEMENDLFQSGTSRMNN